MAGLFAAGLVVMSLVAAWLFVLLRRARRGGTAPGEQGGEERFRSLMLHAPFQIIIKDAEGRYLQVNQAWQKDYGISNAEARGKRPADIFGEELGEHYQDLDRRVLESGAPLVTEETSPARDGTTHKYIATRFPIVDRRGRVAGLGFVATDITDRKTAEEALRDAEERFRAFMDNAPFEILLKDSAGRYVEVNRVWLDYNRKTLQEVVGKMPRDIFGADFGDRAAERDRSALQEGRSLEVDEEFPHVDGTRHMFRTTIFPTRDKDGKPNGVGMVSADITDRNAAERALHASEEQLRTITNNLPVLIVRWDKEQRYRFANKCAEQWYGRPADEIVGRTIPEVFGEKAHRSVLWAIQAALSGETVRFEQLLDYPDGVTRHVEIAYIPDRDEDGAVLGCIALVQDVSERIRAVRALRRSDEQLRAITDNLPALISYVDRDERFGFVNRTAEIWFARPSDEIVGAALTEFITPDDYDQLSPHIERAMAGETVRFEATARYPDGNRRTVDVTYIPDIDGRGRVQGRFALIQDISEQKKLEAELLRKERLAAMGQLTGTVAHELRNPLGAIAMSLGVIGQKTAAAGLDLSRAIDRADRAMRRCESIITEMLDFARARGLQPELTGLDDWLAELLDEYELPPRVTLSRDMRAGGLNLPVDRDELRRAVLNLLDNACDAMVSALDGGEPGELAVSTRVAGDRAEIVFADNGHGIPAEILGDVMEPLFSTKSFGTGLGLPTVKRIMEQHGGGIEIGASPRKGAEVLIWLPADTGSG